MGSLQLITTFIEVSFYLFSIKGINLMFEEHFIRDNQGYFPSRIVHTFFEGFIAQTGPTLHESRHFFRSVFPTVTGWSGTDQNRSDAVTFYIIIDSVSTMTRQLR